MSQNSGKITFIVIILTFTDIVLNEVMPHEEMKIVEENHLDCSSEFEQG